MQYLIPLLLSIPFLTTAQTQKSVTPLAPSTVNRPPSTVRAVVVGISDYQSPQIPDLQFADQDALAFAEWLKSPAGGSVREGNLTLLLNEKATSAHFDAALTGLIEDCKENDEAIIYFSGHGDVETKTIRQSGFLLCWDAPPTGYAAGGAYGLYYIEGVINTLSIQNKAQVIVITDACHAGKLAGSDIGGAQITGANLARQIAGEVKIMSCQPSEFSLEGKEWGGHGVFSYHLLDGLIGLADLDNNGVVNLFEIQHYLDEKVPVETAPHPQFPMTIGERLTPLATVDAISMAYLKERRSRSLQDFTATKSKGFEEAFLPPSDSATRLKYRAFLSALDQSRLLKSASDNMPCADELYAELIKNEQIKPLHNLMRRNFAATLQDEVQQAINALMESDPYEVSNWNANPAHYHLFPLYLERAMELLGPNHFTYTSLASKKKFFEGYLLMSTELAREINPAKRETLRRAARQLFDEAIALNPTAAYLYHAVAMLYLANNPSRSDSVLAFNQKAIERSPNWLLPYLLSAYELQLVDDYQRGEKWLLKAAEISPESYVVTERLAWLRQWQGNTDESIRLCRKMIDLRPDLFSGYSTLSKTRWMRGEFEDALEAADKALSMAPFIICYEMKVLSLCALRQTESAGKLVAELWKNDSVDMQTKINTAAMLADGLIPLRRYDEAIRLARLTDSLNGHISYFIMAKNAEGKALAGQKKWSQARSVLQYVLSMDPYRKNGFYAPTYCWLGIIEQNQENIDAAEVFFQKALAQSSGNFMDDCPFQEEACYYYGRFLLEQNRPTEAESLFLKAVEWRYGNSWYGYYGLALLAAQKGHTTLALDWLEKSLDHYYPIPQPIYEEPLFAKIRKTKRFKALIMKIFPQYQASHN